MQNYTMTFQNGPHIRTLSCQSVRAGDFSVQEDERGVTLLFHLEGGEFEEDRNRNREIIVAVDRHEESSFLVNGEKSMVFHLGDTLIIDGKVQVQFALVEGQGKFLGHRASGNRSGQKTNPFEAHDWLVFVRSVHRTEPCTVSVRLERI